MPFGIGRGQKLRECDVEPNCRFYAGTSQQQAI